MPPVCTARTFSSQSHHLGIPSVSAAGALAVKDLNEPLVDATIYVYLTITSQLLPTPAKSHYTFNLRDLSKVFQGMLMAEPSQIEVSPPISTARGRPEVFQFRPRCLEAAFWYCSVNVVTLSLAILPSTSSKQTSSCHPSPPLAWKQVDDHRVRTTQPSHSGLDGAIGGPHRERGVVLFPSL